MKVSPVQKETENLDMSLPSHFGRRGAVSFVDVVAADCVNGLQKVYLILSYLAT